MFLVTTHIVHHERGNGAAHFIVGLRSPTRPQQYEQKSAQKTKEEGEKEKWGQVKRRVLWLQTISVLNLLTGYKCVPSLF